MNVLLRVWVVAAVVSVLALASPVAAGELSVEGQQTLAKAKSSLAQVEANLELAQQSAGPGTAQPTGSKAKLARLRLDSALSNVKSRLSAWMRVLPSKWNAFPLGVPSMYDCLPFT